MKSFEQAQEILKNLDSIARTMLRREATARLLEDWPEGEGLGSSDVSCECIRMIQHDDYQSPNHDGSIMRVLVEANPKGSVEFAQRMFS